MTKKSGAEKARMTGKRGASGSSSGAVEFNHAMVYTSKLGQALVFYRDVLGLRVVDE